MSSPLDSQLSPSRSLGVHHFGYSFLHISQDLIIRNGNKSSTFWDKFVNHYNKHHLITRTKRITRLFEKKLGTIKHDMNKFMGNYNVVQTFCESGSSENTLQKKLELYKNKHP